jgi:hypothetical protein
MDLQTPLVIIALTVPFFLLTVWAVVDALQRDFDTIGKKAVWCLVAAIPFVGFVFYFGAGRRQGQKPLA